MKIKSILVIILMFAISFSNMAKNTQSKVQNTNWLDSLIAKASFGTNPIIDIKSYLYKDKLVYLINYDAGCCDQYSAALLDEYGKILSHPYGGISGKGDLKTIDFHKERTAEKLIWVNEKPTKKIVKKEKSFKLEKLSN